MVDINTILVIGLIVCAFLVVYIGLAMNHELRTGTPHKMFWEKKKDIKEKDSGK